MFTRITITTLFSLFIFSQESANAIVEVRASYGSQLVKTDPLTKKAPKLSNISGLGADAIISLPLFPLAFGLRYEKLAAKKNNPFGQVEVDFTRASALLSWRFIDTLLFVGAIGTLGLHHGGKTTVKPFHSATQSMDSDISHSYSLGIEAGSKLVGYLIGAEAGYLAMTDEGAGPRQKYDGLYGKIHIGVSF